MTLRSDSRTRTRTRTGIRTTRRLSPCYRHPDEPRTGICPSCLRERLSGLDASSSTTTTASIPPELRRCRSVVSDSKCEASSSTFTEPRRNSCDVVSARSSLSNLFDDYDVKTGSEIDARVESKNLGLSRVTYTIIESGKEKEDEEIRAPGDELGEVDADCVNADGEVEEGEFRTMKEYIDLEFQNKNKKSKDLREIAGNLWGAASILSKKLRKWRQKNSSSKMKDLHSSSDEKSVIGRDKNLKYERGYEENHNEVLGRRSCDTEPRFSIDAGRISIEEPRASWDGYMIARTIPRLAPMLSVVENGVLGNINRFENHRLSVDGPMHSIIEDESSSGGSGNSNSDSSSSMVHSSFDRSSSVRSFGKKVESSEDHGVSPANVKLVITEKELKDWRLNSNKDKGIENSGSFPGNTPTVSAGNLNVPPPPKKSVRWNKIYNVLGFRPKNNESKSESVKGNAIDPSINDISDKHRNEAGNHLKDVNGWKLTRSTSVVGPRNSCDAIESNYRRRSVDNAGGWAYKGAEEAPERNGIADYSSTGLENGITPFYMTPLRSLRNSKSGKFKLQNSHSIPGKILQLN